MNRGKALLKAAVLQERDSGCGLVSDIGNQAVLLGQVANTDEILALIDSVTQSDVSSVSTILIFFKEKLGNKNKKFLFTGCIQSG